MKLVIGTDIQNDFITGSLNNPAAQAAMGAVVQKLDDAEQNGDEILLSADSHAETDEEYLKTQEGKILPVPHCKINTWGWELDDRVERFKKHRIVSYRSGGEVVDNLLCKCQFGSNDLFDKLKHMGLIKFEGRIAVPTFDSVEVIGFCSDICVISMLIMVKALFPEIPVYCDVRCIAGVTPESNAAAITIMKMCQVIIIGE